MLTGTASMRILTLVGALALAGCTMVPDYERPAVPEPAHWPLLIAVGLIGGTAQIFLTQAFRLAPPSVVAPFDYSAMLWAVAIGWLVFDNLPSLQSLAGAAVICASGLFILYRETVRGVRKPPVKRSSI